MQENVSREVPLHKERRKDVLQYVSQKSHIHGDTHRKLTIPAVSIAETFMNFMQQVTESFLCHLLVV